MLIDDLPFVVNNVSKAEGIYPIIKTSRGQKLLKNTILFTKTTLSCTIYEMVDEGGDLGEARAFVGR